MTSENRTVMSENKTVTSANTMATTDCRTVKLGSN